MSTTKPLRRVTAAIPEDLHARLDRIRSRRALVPDDPDTGPSVSVCIRQALEYWCEKKEKEYGMLL